MDFAFTEDQESLRQLARTIIGDLSTHERLKEIEHDAEPMDRRLWAELAKANLLGLAVPEEYGGSGLGILELALLCEEAGRAVARVPLVPTLVASALTIAAFGPPQLRERYLPGIATGEILLTAALEERLNEAPARPSTVAVSEGSGWRVHGTRSNVAYAHAVCRILVPARLGNGEVIVLLVDPEADGVTVERQVATNLEPMGRVALDGVLVDEALEGGQDALRFAFEHSLGALCAVQSGVCEGALRMTAEYTSTREQFDRPLAAFQAVAQRAADAYVDAEAVRLTAWQAVWRLSEGLPASGELAVAKFWASEGAQRVVHAAQHLHGGIGVDVDYPLHRYFLWAKQLELTLGAATPSLLRLGAELAAEGV